ncbi:MerR family transcriptional regulator [Aliagarivorans taiwanensis]|uniref:MerR family transcriptional regulator n=1 Tax=Aliagarivorans taiwanensis TaxID=561966 RepID=UPI0004034A11|nr:MerR family transcriptional regulator [Aliagarivorans taiwanensis]
MKLYRIGQLSKLFDVSVDTLRHYEKLGLLKPEVVKESGYRYYSNRQIWRLSTIRRFRALDVSLEEIAGYMSDQTLDKTLDASAMILQRIAQKKRELEELEGLLKRKVQDVNEAIAEADNTEVRLCEFAERRIWQVNKLAGNYWDIDRFHREIESQMSLSTEGNITRTERYGAAISLRDFERGHFERYSSSFIMHETGPEALAAGQYLCLSYWGHENIEDIAPRHLQLKKYMQGHGWQANGPILEIYVLDLHETDEPSEFLTEIQVPVKLIGLQGG